MTGANAESLALAAYSGVPLGGIVSGAQLAPEPDSRIHSYDLAATLLDALFQADFSSTGNAAVGAVISLSGTVAGNCGGTAAYSLSVNDENGGFTGVLELNAYCYNGTVISGAVSCYGIYNIPESRFINLNVVLDSLTARDVLGTYSASGLMVANFPSSTSFNCAMTLYLGRSGKVYWMNNYFLEAAQFPGYIQMLFSGTYYHPDYGYVYVTTSTSTPFQVPTGAPNPSQGVMIGRAGSRCGRTES